MRVRSARSFSDGVMVHLVVSVEDDDDSSVVGVVVVLNKP